MPDLEDAPRADLSKVRTPLPSYVMRYDPQEYVRRLLGPNEILCDLPMKEAP